MKSSKIVSLFELSLGKHLAQSVEVHDHIPHFDCDCP